MPSCVRRDAGTAPRRSSGSNATTDIFANFFTELEAYRRSFPLAFVFAYQEAYRRSYILTFVFAHLEAY